jgi:hypothetical protein
VPAPRGRTGPPPGKTPGLGAALPWGASETSPPQRLPRLRTAERRECRLRREHAYGQKNAATLDWHHFRPRDASPAPPRNTATRS